MPPTKYTEMPQVSLRLLPAFALKSAVPPALRTL